MEIVDINAFNEVRECVYKNERYSVRDNGAVMRHPRDNKRKRKLDNTWTFGKKNEKNGYLYISSHRIHVIVATAFYEKKDSKIYVVDHIDTNRCNNRKENLRWLTRLENALLNPITLKRIEYSCGGDITKFIKDPSCLKDVTGTNSDLSWMRTVSPKEAEVAYNNTMRWSSKPSSHEKPKERSKGINPDYIFRETQQQAPIINNISMEFTRAVYPENALQKNWKTPTNFRCCPLMADKDNPIKQYADALERGKIFSHNQYATHEVIDFAVIDDGSVILIITHDTAQDASKPFALAKVYHSGGQYIHESIRSFFDENGARKKFILLQGGEWDGPSSIDDFC